MLDSEHGNLAVFHRPMKYMDPMARPRILMPRLTDLCLAMRSDPLRVKKGLVELVSCVYGPAVTYAFPDPLITAYRHSVIHMNVISVLDRIALSWWKQEHMRLQLSKTVLFGKIMS